MEINKVMERVLRALCPHRFGWPRIGVNGQDYQVCLICGTTYAYDWATMKRTNVLSPVGGSAELVHQGKRP